MRSHPQACLTLSEVGQTSPPPEYNTGLQTGSINNITLSEGYRTQMAPPAIDNVIYAPCCQLD